MGYPESLASYDDFLEVETPDLPLSVADASNGKYTVARAITIEGGGDIELITASGGPDNPRARTDISDPYFVEVKTIALHSGASVLKVIFWI